MADENEVLENEVPEENAENEGPSSSVQVGLHPLGGIGVGVTSAAGDKAQAQITVDEAWRIIGHLTALTSMMVGGMYAAAAQEQASIMEELKKSKVVVPGRS